MRNDMQKVITEPARRGVSYYRTESNDYRLAKNFKIDEDLNVNDEYCDRVLPMRAKKVGWDGKDRSYLYQVAKRFLTSSIGRHWNNVYSEIAKMCNTDVAKASDLRALFTRNVETHTFVGDDGRIYYTSNCMSRYGTFRDAAGCVEEEPGTFYVDPRDGKLKLSSGDSRRQERAKRKAIQKAEADKSHRDFQDGKKFRFVEGVWFSVTRIPRVLTTYYGGREQKVEEYIETKRTASKREIRDYKLNG
jgi:hypothetical protein